MKLVDTEILCRMPCMCSLAAHVEAVAIDTTGAKGIGACCTSVA